MGHCGSQDNYQVNRIIAIYVTRAGLKETKSRIVFYRSQSSLFLLRPSGGDGGMAFFAKLMEKETG
jgi:hypothetical protein